MHAFFETFTSSRLERGSSAKRWTQWKSSRRGARWLAGATATQWRFSE